MTDYASGHLMTFDTGVAATTSGIDSSYVDFAYDISYGYSSRCILPVTQTAAWFHARFGNYNSGGSTYDASTIFGIVDDLGNWIVYIAKSGGTYHLFRNNGTVTDMGAVAMGGTPTIDIKLVIDATNGVIEYYVASSLIYSFYGDTVGTLTGRKISYARFYGANTINNQRAYISESLWGLGAAASTVGFRVFSKAVNAAGTHAGWTGAYTDVDETGAPDSQYNSASAPGARQTYNTPDLPASVSEYGIRAVLLQAYGTADAGIDFGFTSYIGATDYDNAAVGANTVPANYELCLPHNPATSANWTKTEVNALESGVISI